MRHHLAIRLLACAALTFPAATAALSDTPAGLSAFPSGTGRIDLVWTDTSSSESGYRIERSADGGASWSQVGTAAADATAWTDSGGLAPKARYVYRVAAEVPGGATPWSNAAEAVTVYRGMPLSDWIDVTSDGCGAPGERPCAAGDGVTDDTEALQRAINSLSGFPGRSTPHVLYFPGGTYLIRDTLFLEGQIGVQFIGEAPGLVTIRWADDAPPGTRRADGRVVARPMFHSEGNRYSTWRNLVWDANQVPYVVAFDQSWCGNSDNQGLGGRYNSKCDAIAGNPWFPGLRPDVGYADASCGHIDSVFKNAWIGVRLNHYNNQVEESTFRRCGFENNQVGVSLEDPNTMEHWFWDCRFADNEYYGIMNYLDDLEGDGTFEGDGTDNAGTFRILRGRFSGNGLQANPAGSLWNRADVGYAPDGQFTLRECWSKGSGQFVFGQGANQTSRQMSIIGSQVDDFDPLGTHGARAVDIRNSGTVLMIDNRIDSDGREEPVHHEVGPAPAQSDLLAISNAFSASDPYGPDLPNPGFKRRTIDDSATASFDLVIPPVPVPVNPLDTRPIYTVTDGRSIQHVLDAAGADPEPAVVHFPSGAHAIPHTLHVPAGSDLVILGNGPGTRIEWDGVSPAILEIDGHQVDNLVVRDLLFYGRHGNQNVEEAIRVRDLNQEDSRALISRMVFSAAPSRPAPTTSIAVEGCDRVKVDVLDTVVFGQNANNVGLRLAPGPQPQEGTSVWSGFFALNHIDFDVSNNVNGVNLMVSSTYMENSQHYLRARGGEGPGDVTIHASKLATQQVDTPGTTNAVWIDGFRGNLSVLNSHIDSIDPASLGARIEEIGAPDLSIQAIGNTVWWDPEFAVSSSTRFVRSNQKYGCVWGPTDPDLHGCDAPTSPAYVPMPDLDCLGASCAPYDPATSDPQLLAGLGRLRDATMPGFYDEAGSVETYQVNFDNVHVTKAARGLVLSGGIPDEPALLTAAGAGSTVLLDWNGSTDPDRPEDAFVIERAPGASGPFAALATIGGGTTSWTDATVAEGTEYAYRVLARRNRTGDSGYSNVATINSGPISPDGLEARPVWGRMIVLRWNDRASTETGFIIERSDGAPGAFREIDRIDAPDTTRYLDRGNLTRGETYYYRVRTTDGRQVSPASDVTSATVGKRSGGTTSPGGDARTPGGFGPSN